MRFRRSEDQEKIAEGDLVRLLPTMIYTPSIGNPVGAIGKVLEVVTLRGQQSIRVLWILNKDREHLEVYSAGYQMSRDLEKVVMYLDPPHIKYNSKEVVIL